MRWCFSGRLSRTRERPLDNVSHSVEESESEPDEEVSIALRGCLRVDRDLSLAMSDTFPDPSVPNDDGTEVASLSASKYSSDILD